jgi:hypothetical protein
LPAPSDRGISKKACCGCRRRAAAGRCHEATSFEPVHDAHLVVDVGRVGWGSEPRAITIMGSYPYLVVGDDDCHR